MTDVGYHEIDYGAAVTVLAAANGGAYPCGNTVLVRGTDSTLVIDPSLAVGGAPPAADAVFVSHAHEDHLAGLRWFHTPVYAHVADVDAVRSLPVLMHGYGLPSEARDAFAETVARDFGVQGRPHTQAVEDGHVFDLGDRTVTVVHLPGHTAGHCGLLVEPDGFFFVADIDLTSFGPFYGDLGSSLTDFEASIDRCRSVEARWYGTFHQQGVIEGAPQFRARLNEYRNVIAVRDRRLLDFVTEPRSIAQIAGHRLVYRPHVDEPYVEAVERRTAQRHVARLLDLGAVAELEPGVYRTAPTGQRGRSLRR